MADDKQYVNLRKNTAFIGGDLKSRDQMGYVPIKFKFKNSDAMPVKFRTVLVSEKSPYTATEKKRNMWYALQSPISLEMNEGTEWEASVDALLPPSGGAVYKIEALAGDKTVASKQLETWRRLFFQAFVMNDPSGVVRVPKKLSSTTDYYRNELFVDLVNVSKDPVQIPYLQNATENDLTALAKPSYVTCPLKVLEPYSLVLVFSDALPSLAELHIGGPVLSGEVDLPARWFGNDKLIYELPKNKFVWWGLNPKHDAKNGGKGVWLRGDATITVEGKTTIIPKDAITLDKTHTEKNGHAYNRLILTLPPAARNNNRLFSQSATLKMTLWVLEGFSAGWAQQGYNVLTVARRAWWRNPDTDDTLLGTINHEFGHMLGMVPKGGRRYGDPYELDGPDKLYGDIDIMWVKGTPSPALRRELEQINNSKGHQGCHCERGVTAKKVDGQWKWKGTPACTMFGSQGTDDGHTSPSKFCDPCKQLVIRQNLDPADPMGVITLKSLF